MILNLKKLHYYHWKYTEKIVSCSYHFLYIFWAILLNSQISLADMKYPLLWHVTMSYRCCSVIFSYVVAGPSTWVFDHLCRVNMSCYSWFMFRGQIISFVLIQNFAWVTFIIHIEGPIRSYEVLLEQWRYINFNLPDYKCLDHDAPISS